ncbi:unnamed protein product [Euphydryas editha]|uniref:Integrase catalytic domain-containing protein n=1 Tax=Euphydryas editha TaxID=104508 RepID=A0AAU9UPF4_EUPED|nr:unnamed protein product [Euphydryas editha]
MPLTRSQAEKMEQELEAIQERSPEDTSNIAEQSKPSNVPVRHEEPPRSPSADPGQRKHSKPSSKKASKEKKLLKLREEIAQRKLELAIARAEAAALESDDDDSEDSSHDGDNRVTEWLDTHPEVTTKPIAQDPEVPIAKPTTHTEKNNSVIIEKEAPEIATVASNSIDLTQLAAAITTAARSAGTSRYIGELPYFNGSHTEWLAFRAAYYESSTQLSAAENSARIRRALKGKAKEAVASLLIANAPAIDIMKTLETRFGRPDAIAITELEKLRNLPRLTDSPRDICAYANKIKNCVATLRLLAKDQYLYSPEIIKQLVEKLTPTTRFRWFDYATSNDIEKTKTEPELVLFCDFIEREADRCAKYAPPEQINNEETTTPVRRHRALVTNDRKFPCPICKEKEHEPSDCSKIKTAEQHRRWEIAKDANLCYRCLRYRSQTHKCKTRVCGKNGCERTHHPLLHFTPTNKEDRREETEKVTTTHSHKELHAYLKYIPVRISGPKKTIDTYALLDDGSTVTLIEENIASKIGAKGPKDPLNIETIDTKLATHSSRRVTFNIKGQEKEFKLQARTIKKMKISPQSINKEQVRACEHLKDIADDISYKDARPTILIGQDNWHLLIASETKKGNRSQLVASKTPLGWVLHGSGSRTVGQRVHFVYNLADIDIESDESRMDEMLRHHFALDSIDIAEKKPRSDPEQKVLDILEANTVRTEGGQCETALQCIENNSNTSNNYAHSIAATEETTSNSEWRWVPTKLNNADDATRDVPCEFDKAHRWFTGPPFLRKHPSEWPSEVPTKVENTGEERTHHITTKTSISVSQSVPDSTRFSKWERLVRATARVLQFIQLCRGQRTERVNYRKKKQYADPDWSNKDNKKHIGTKSKQSRHYKEENKYLPIEAALLRQAESLIVKSIQQDSFSDEVYALRSGKSLSNNSRLRLLSTTFVDGIIRVKSRVNAAAGVTESQKSPAVIDGDHRATRLYIEYTHRSLQHAGVETVVNECRQHYWVLRLRPVTRVIVRSCLPCRIRRAAPPSPPTGDLPPTRLAHHQRPFTYTGIDYFGPFTVTIGRRHEKRYVALFTCLTTRAVHLEVAASLSTDSAILALRRMIARRGCPTEIWSDNGTNFHGADAELKKAALQATSEEANIRTITWRYIPPGAPFMGGAWERLVRSVKTALTAVLQERSPQEEVLATLLAEAEYTVNSRPLTHVSVDIEDPEALTPNHILLGGSARVPLPGKFEDRDLIGRPYWRAAQRLADQFWARWVREYLPELQHRREPRGSGPAIAVGDVVLIVDGNLPRNTWPRGVVIATYPGQDGTVRVVDVRTSGGILRRPTKRLVQLTSASVVSPSTEECSIVSSPETARRENVRDNREGQRQTVSFTHV